MEASLLNQWFSGQEIKAICWTLIHSLWIGLIIALLCGIVIAGTRKSAAALRYRLLCGLLVLFVCAIGVTYYLEASAASAPTVPEHSSNIMLKAPANLIVSPAAVAQNQTLLGGIQAFLNQNMNIVFLVWMLLFILKSLKMVSGLLYIQRIRNYRTHDIAEEFKHKIEVFSRQIGIRQTVRLVQSELVKVPVAVGWLKPMILLPLGIVFQLTPEQLDGILWHELAHIRRRDYLVNILQGIVETVFFFNPGLLWLSSLIRTEREACCDDMVLSRMNRKANYLEALLSFGYGEFKQAGLAMSIGSGNQLRDRLKRMINQENKRLSVAERSVLAVGLVLLSAFTTMPKTTTRAVQGLVNVITKKRDTAAIIKPMLMKLAVEVQPVHKPRSFAADTTIKKIDTAITFVSVLFKNSDADLVNNDISAMDDKGKKYHFIVADNKLVAMDINGEEVKESDLPNYQFMITQIDIAVLEKRHIRETDIARFKANQPGVKFKAGRRYDDKHRDIDSMTSAYMKVMNDIIADLVVHNVVSKAADVKWFALTNNELIVNGQKQPDELQQRYKAEYGVREDRGLYYGPVPMKGKGVFIDPEGMIKERRLFDSIQSARFNARLGTDDERRTLKLQMMSQRLHDDSTSYAEQRQRALNVIADLVTDKVVPGAASVKWFGLSNTEFIVNGQKQPDEMQQRYKAKYGIYEGNGLYYGPVQMHGVGVFIDATQTPGRPSRPPRPKYIGATGTGSQDNIAWKQQELIRQQQLFIAKENEKRAHIVEQQLQLVEQQQRFAEEQNSKRERMQQEQAHEVEQQRNFADEQNAKRAEIMEKQRQLLVRQAEQGKEQRQLGAPKMSINLQPAISGVIADLMGAKVISDKSDLIKFNLTNTALMVNGKKQPDELHERLKAKYLEQPKLKFGITSDPNFGLHYDVKNNAMGIGISIDKNDP